MHYKNNNIKVKVLENKSAYIFINRPKVRNAINIETITEIKQALVILKENKLVRIIIISGSGSFFFIWSRSKMDARFKKFRISRK